MPAKPTTAIMVIVGVILAAILIFLGFNRKTDIEPVIPGPAVAESPKREVIGSSVEGRQIESFTYGEGDTHIVFVGGIHGGYEWNSVMLAYAFLDYLKVNPEIIPKNLKITIIPSANPDGLFKVIPKEGRITQDDAPNASQAPGTGRFNANGVDLNRNFDCKWKPESTWRSQKVSAGTAPFSEPESKAIRDFTLKHKPEAFVFWHSQANAVYASECENGILPETLGIMNAYAKAAGYNAVASFDAYPVTGDVEGWLASIEIPAITVELKTHETIEWEKNLAGVKALLDYFNQP